MSKRKNDKVYKLNRTVRINSAIFIFVVILIYVLASVLKALTKEPVTTYKVSSSNINNNITCTGIALRSENEVKSSKSGYLIYFVRDGDKVKKNSAVCTVDETGNVINTIKEAGQSEEGNKLFTNSDYASIRNTIDNYKASYSDINFSNLYNFKADIESKVMELSNEAMVDEMNKGGASLRSTLETINAPDSGIIAYYTDGFESTTVETVTLGDFNKSNYKKESLKSGDIMNSGSTVFKIVSEENWKIVCQLTDEQAVRIQQESQLRFTINNSNTEIVSDYEIVPKDDSFILVLSLSKYMIDYIDERMLNIEIILDKYDGLKVPNTALVDKEAYKIPNDFVIKEENSPTNKVYVNRYDEDGNVKQQLIDILVYKEDDDFHYVDESAFSDTDTLVMEDGSNGTNVLSLERANLTGVYLANEGVADFTEVEVIKTQDEFSIVKDDYNLKEFDNIVLDSSGIIENQTLY